MSDVEEPEPIAVFECGPNKKCEHVWDGPELRAEREGGGGMVSATCSKCGIDALSVSLWEGP